LTEIAKVTSSVSVSKPARAARKKAPAKVAANSAAQSANAHKRWAATPAAARSENSREMAHVRWAADEQSEATTKKYYETEDLDTAMESYQNMRRTFEMAGRILDGRFQSERQAEEKCSNPECGKHFDRNTPWFYRNAIRNPITGAAYNEFACSQACMIAIKAVGTQKRA
jgi:hypothetical protein